MPTRLGTFRLIGMLLAAILTTACSHQETPKRLPVRLAVGGAEQLVYMPVTLARELGYYEAEGLDVKLDSFQGGAKSLQALWGGSADVVAGFYDHTIQMAAEGRQLRAFVTMLRYPGCVLAVSPAAGSRIHRITDLKGSILGVTAPGSSTHLLLTYLLARAGLAATDVSVIGIGGAATALAAVERASVDAAIMTEPAFSQLQKRHPRVALLADTRTAAGVRAVFGVDTYPASVLYATPQWLERNPEAARRLASAIRHALRWIQEHKPEEIAARMPASYRGDDPAIYVEALTHSLPMYSPDGRMPEDGPPAVRSALAASLPAVRNAKLDLASTYTNAFVPPIP